MPKLRVGIVFGGRSTEHEVSVASATTIFQALDPARYTPILIGVDPDGRWRVAEGAALLPEAVFASAKALPVFPTLRDGLGFLAEGRDAALRGPLDVVFPIVHGRGGEDGTLQGLLELAGVPYVGAGVLATALCMDKGMTKRALRDAGLPVVLPWLEASTRELRADGERFAARVERVLAFPVFVKPVNTGSSVGIVRCATSAELREGLREAARYDLDVLAEPGLDVREIECAVLGGHAPEASVVGEIVPAGAFYDYEAKYASEDTQLLVPAPIPEAVAERVREMAQRAFVATRCWGMARVDFFLARRGEELWVNELNTLPGFTDQSMYPRLWEASGLPLPGLVDRLVELALERHRERADLEVRYRRR